MDASNRTECLTGTRVDILKYIEDWTDDLSSERSVLWLHALAGAGKSTLSTTLANRFRAAGRLGAFLFFDRDVTERNDPNTVVRTIAYQMGLYDRRLGLAIVAAIEKTPNICFLAPRIQFRKLVIEPLSESSSGKPKGLYEKILRKLGHQEKPIVVLLDALDECGDAVRRRQVLEVLAEETIGLACILRIIVTSRFEHDIRSSLESLNHVLLRELDTTSTASATDILLYFRYRAAQTRNANKDLKLPSNWPGEYAIQKLANRASGIFVWASTAWGYIESTYDPRKHLEVVLDGNLPPKAEAALDALYRTALNSADKWEDMDFIKDFGAIMGVVISAKNPLSPAAIDQILGLSQERPSLHQLSHLGCVLSWNPVVRILHPSFTDFLCSRTRCGRDIWFFDPACSNHMLAIHCLQYLCSTLQRNGCNLTLSQNLENATLSESLTYACVFWVDHVCAVKDDINSIIVHMDKFLNKQLLHWFEAMSILRKSRDTITLLDNLSSWIMVGAC